MKRTAVLFAALVASIAVAMEVDMTPQEKAQCEAEGGCVFATVAAINQRIKAAYEAGVNFGVKRCRSGA